LAAGFFGTSPFMLGNYFSMHNIHYKSTTKLSTLNSWAKKGSVFIISFWNTKRTRDGAHTIAVKCVGKDSFVTYNNAPDDHTPQYPKSFAEMIGGGSLIIGYHVY